ncbi:MAG: DUF1871 family protein [Nitrospira sp.]
MSSEKYKQKYKQMFSLVRAVINRWDPYGLLAGGAPEDEFEHETALVVAKVKTIKTETDATVVLSEVFSDAFEPQYFTVEACAQVGRDLFHELKSANVI